MQTRETSVLGLSEELDELRQTSSETFRRIACVLDASSLAAMTLVLDTTLLEAVERLNELDMAAAGTGFCRLVERPQESATGSAAFIAELTSRVEDLRREIRIPEGEDAKTAALRVALQVPAVELPPVSVVPSGNPVRDLRDWTALTNRELAEISRVSERRLADWTKGASISSSHETQLLALRYMAQVLAGTLGRTGTRRWFRAPHPSLGGASPIKALAEGRDEDVKRLVEAHLESAAT